MNVKVVCLWGYRYQLLLQSGNTRVTYSKFCVLALGLTQVLTCSFSAPFHSGSRLITSSFQSATHALQQCRVPQEILFKCDICCHGDCVIPLTSAQKWSIIFLVRSLKIGFQVTVNSKEDAVLSRVAFYTHDFSLFGFSLLSQTHLGKLIQKITSGITSRLSNRCLCKKSSVQYIYQGRFHVYIPDQIKKVLKDLFASGSRLGDMYIYIFSKFKKHFENIQHIFVVSVTIIALDCGFSLRIPQNADCLR